MDEFQGIVERELPDAEEMSEEERDRLEGEIIADGIAQSGVRVLGRDVPTPSAEGAGGGDV